MKYTIALFIALLGLCYGQIDEEAVEKFLKDVFENSRLCQAETNVDRESMIGLLRGEIPDKREAKCYVSCFLMKFGLQNEDGSFNKEKALDEFEKFKSFNEDIYEKAVAVVETCSKEVGTPGDPCEGAATMARCTFSTAKQNGLDKEMVKVFAG